MITLTAEDLPLSSVFLDFLARFVDPTGFADECWHDQLSEALGGAPRQMRQSADARLQRLALSDAARSAIERAYGWCRELVRSELQALQRLHERYQFVAVMGVPRSGGSYLVAELFAALGHEPASVPAALAHDGFPESGPTVFMPRHNGWMRTMLTTSEYITMVELFFGQTPEGRVVVPKKLTKGVYAGGFFRQILGPAQIVVTVRHPLACCISTYEKSGGLPPGGAVMERSTIEHWIKRDLRSAGIGTQELAAMDYFSAYLRYWEQYHIALAMSGLIRNARTTIIAFGAARMQELALQWHRRFASGRAPREFLTRTGLWERHPQWMQRSVEAIERVANLWRWMGLAFPTAEVSECL